MVDPASRNITVENLQRYSYTFNEWDSLWNISSITNTIDNPPLSLFRPGDRIVVVFHDPHYWGTIARLSSDGSGREFVTDLYGDMGLIPLPLAQNYGFETDYFYDCSACDGATCPISYVNVTVLRGHVKAASQRLGQGGSLHYIDRNDESGITVIFYSGEHEIYVCPDRVKEGSFPDIPGGGYGKFEIHVISPAGVGHINNSMEATTWTGTVPVPLPVSPVSSEPTKSGTNIPLILAAGFAFFFLVYGRKRL